MANFRATTPDEKAEFEIENLAKLIYTEAVGALLASGHEVSSQICFHLCTTSRRAAIEYINHRPMATVMAPRGVNPDDIG